MEIGKCYYVRTLTDHWIGRVKEVHPFAVSLVEASWVADSGRLSTFVAEGEADDMEIEPVGEVTAVWIAYIPWKHPLFTKAV